MIALLLTTVAVAGSPAPDLQARLPSPTPIECAATDEEWAQSISHYSLPPSTVAFTDHQTWTIHLPSSACSVLRDPSFSPSNAHWYFTFYHEYIHASEHTTDEGKADCDALQNLQTWLTTLYHFSPIDSRQAYEIAWQIHVRLPESYRGTCTYIPYQSPTPQKPSTRAPKWCTYHYVRFPRKTTSSRVLQIVCTD